jgi:uncharacterized membrane protein YjjB (DUF3815 family)
VREPLTLLDEAERVLTLGQKTPEGMLRISVPVIPAFVACLIVGVIVTPLAERLRLPFAGIAFASVVSLIPGIFLFRMGGGLLTLIALGAKAPTGLLQDVIVDGATAFLIVLAMVFGLIIPKPCMDRHRLPRN